MLPSFIRYIYTGQFYTICSFWSLHFSVQKNRKQCPVEAAILLLTAQLSFLVTACTTNLLNVYTGQERHFNFMTECINKFTFPGLLEAENDDVESLKDIATKLQLHELANDIEERRGRSAGKKKNKKNSKWGTIIVNFCHGNFQN